MASVNELLDLKDFTIRFKAPEGEYEGIIREVFAAAKVVIIGKVILLPAKRLGTLNFQCSEIQNMKVIRQPDRPKESIEKKDILPVYQKTFTEKLFDLDGSSDIEDDESADNPQDNYELKIVHHLTKFVPRDFEIIDTFDKDFNLAIKHIKKQDAIGVSLEGIKICRSGTLTWLCISTSVCNFLFDILALGKQAFDKGLKSIFENARIQKIFHDCRLASDCLHHKYGVRLVNVFDTQAADFIVMMQMVEREKIDSRVNTLDACLSYYLEVPDNYLYGPANLNNNCNSPNFHASRPLKSEILDVMIKNVMYLHLLKRELELALLTPLRRTTDVYLNSVQRLHDKELLIVPHKPHELPPDIHLEGIQIFRYRDFEYLCSMNVSGPPYREVCNPIKNYLNHRAEYKDGQRKDSQSILNVGVNENSLINSSRMNYKSSVDFQKPTSSSDESGKSGEKHLANCNRSDTSDQKEKTYAGNRVYLVSHNKGESEKLQPFKDNNAKNQTTHNLLSPGSKSRDVKAVEESIWASTINSKVSTEIPTLNNESIKFRSSSSSESSSFESTCNPPCSNNISKSELLQITEPNIAKKSNNQRLLEFISKMVSKSPPKTANSSYNYSENQNIASLSLGRKDGLEDNGAIPKTDIQINNSVAKNDVDISDFELKEIEARVRARGALRNYKNNSASDCASTSDAFRRNVQEKVVKNSNTFVKNEESTSEEVTIYYSETLDKPSKFVVKVNHRRTCLADLYQKAGDRSLNWTDEDTTNHNEISSNQPDVCGSSEDIWSTIREDMPTNPFDEKLKARLVPAGMDGY